MEVTSQNFREASIDTLLKECTFVSIDGEFTGLRTGKQYSLNMFDTAEDRYRKHSAGSEGMFLVEVGLSFFKHLYLNEYEVSTFNFVISPKAPHFCVHDRFFTCQTSSLELLFKSGFSFDKCFKEGITYISQMEEEACKKSLEHRAGRRTIPSDDSGRVNNNRAPWWQNFETNICKKLDEALLQGTESLVLSDFTDEERSVLLRVIEKKYYDKFVLLSKTVNLLKDPSDWLKLHLEDLDNCVGFSSVIKKLSQSGKPIVGHNIYLDLIHLYRQFVGPLPHHYEEAKTALHTVFPRVIDTKLIASMDPLKDWTPYTGLPELYKAVQKSSAFKQPKIKHAQYGPHSEDHLHQAGYDSYITGIVFVALVDKLCQLKEEKAPEPVDATCLHSYFNKVFMFRSWDYNYISLDRPDNSPNRRNVFHVKFPTSFKTENVLELFKANGKVQIGWIDDTSAFVGLQDGDQVPFAMKRLCSSSVVLPEGVSVRPWNLFAKRKSTTEIDEVMMSDPEEGEIGYESTKKPKIESATANEQKQDHSTNGKNGSGSASEKRMFDVPEQW